MPCPAVHEPMCPYSCLHPLVRPGEDREVISKQLLVRTVSCLSKWKALKGVPPGQSFLWGLLQQPCVPKTSTSLVVGWDCLRGTSAVCCAGSQQRVRSIVPGVAVTANGTSSRRRELDLGILSSPSSAPMSCGAMIYEDTTRSPGGPLRLGDAGIYGSIARSYGMEPCSNSSDA